VQNIIKNMTPHEIVVNGTPFKASGQVARVSVIRVKVQEEQGISLYHSEFGEVENLPPKEDGVLLLVSAMVRLSLPNRNDLLSPGTLIRDEKGVPIGCDGLDCN